MVERQDISAFGKFDDDGIVGTLGAVVFGEFEAKASGLHSDGGIRLGIEVTSATEDFGGDLVFLERCAGVIDRVLGEVLQELAEGFRSVKDMTINKPIYFLGELLAVRPRNACNSHDTKK